MQAHTTALAFAPNAEEMHEQFRAARAHQTAQTEHFADAQSEVDLRKRDRTPSMRNVQTFYFQHRLAWFGGAARKQFGDLATNHVLDHFALVRLARGEGDDRRTIT